MSPDREFDPETSPLVYGPIAKQRWIYACSKQLMDRVIWAYGEQRGLDFTLFRPFNWIGAGLDSINTAKEGSSRVGDAVLRPHRARREDPAGGRRPAKNARSPTSTTAYQRADGDHRQPRRHRLAQDLQHRQSAQQHLGARARQGDGGSWRWEFPEYRSAARKVKIVNVTSQKYYGSGYQDMQNRVPKIANTMRDLRWRPKVGLRPALRRIYDAYRSHVAEAKHLVKGRARNKKSTVDTYRGTLDGVPRPGRAAAQAQR